MIFVTGDVHDMDMGGPDQACLRERGMKTEMDCAVQFADMAAQHHVYVTLFVTGKAARQEPHALSRLKTNPYVEIGGHTWNGLQPPWKHMAREKIQGSYYGKHKSQLDDIRNTLQAIEDRTGTKPVSWRTHAYRGDETTNRILDELGCRIVSDAVGPFKKIEHVGQALRSLPINTPPDHEHLFHGQFTLRWYEWDQALRRDPWNVFSTPHNFASWKRAAKEIGKRVLGVRTPAKSFGNVYCAKMDWWSWVRTEISERINEIGFATLLLHPVCMKVLDNMTLLDTIFEEIGKYSTACVSECEEILSE